MAKFFKVKNLERFQHYKQRNPPWIKLHTLLLEDYEFGFLSDPGKWHLVAIWLLASRKSNRLPWDPHWLAKKIPTKSKINLEELERLGFIECYQDESTLLAPCEQNADSEREGEKRESRGREEKSGKPDAHPLELKTQAQEVLAFLNERVGRAYRATDTNLDFILGRLRSGATVQDCKSVIAKKRREWIGDPKMAEYLRPATLFNKTKFEQYLGEIVEDPT